MHTTMGPGAGLTSAVSPAGGHATSVPLDLPSPRAPIPVPVAVVHDDSGRAGAAGLGWDVPLSYVRRSTDSWHRKPSIVAGGDDAAPEQVTLVLGGVASLMVRTGDHYVPFAADSYQELRETASGWTLRTLDNLEYAFAPGFDVGMWMLVSIRDLAGRDEVILRYASAGMNPLIEGCAYEPRLASVAYTFLDPALGKVPLYEIELDYQPWWRPSYRHAAGDQQACRSQPGAQGFEVALPFEHVQDHSLSFERTRTISAIRVMARDNLSPDAPARPIRQYQLSYEPDPATDQPRLRAVTTTGEAGTPEGDPNMPCSSLATVMATLRRSIRRTRSTIPTMRRARHSPSCASVRASRSRASSSRGPTSIPA
jgi:hypothetical protein